MILDVTAVLTSKEDKTPFFAAKRIFDVRKGPLKSIIAQMASDNSEF